MVTKYTWTELEWMWEQDKLETRKAIEQLIQWGHYTHGIAVLNQHRLAIQESEIQTLMQANIRWGIRVEELEGKVAEMAAQITESKKGREIDENCTT